MVVARDRIERMIVRPPTQFARSGVLHVAYQTLGDGPIDIVFVAPGQTSVETAWGVPKSQRRLVSVVNSTA